VVCSLRWGEKRQVIAMGDEGCLPALSVDEFSGTGISMRRFIVTRAIGRPAGFKRLIASAGGPED